MEILYVLAQGKGSNKGGNATIYVKSEGAKGDISGAEAERGSDWTLGVLLWRGRWNTRSTKTKIESF